MEGKVRVEVLFPEIANLYGDLENIEYLKKSCPEIEVVNTHLTGEPEFINETPSLIYMGTLTEEGQLLAVEKLSKYREKLIEMIEGGVHFLVTGNGLEVFGGEIEDADGTVCCGLRIFPIHAKRDMMHRFNSLYLGSFENMDIVGYKSQFTHSWRDDDAESAAGAADGACAVDGAGGDGGRLEHVFDTKRGPGLNPDVMGEGIRKNNFLGTYVIGPLLVLNPPFTKWLLKEIGAGDVTLAFEKEAMEAYEARVREYSDPNTGFYY